MTETEKFTLVGTRWTAKAPDVPPSVLDMEISPGAEWRRLVVVDYDSYSTWVGIVGCWQQLIDGKWKTVSRRRVRCQKSSLETRYHRIGDRED